MPITQPLGGVIQSDLFAINHSVSARPAEKAGFKISEFYPALGSPRTPEVKMCTSKINFLKFQGPRLS
jgi:hypothetical protein